MLSSLSFPIQEVEGLWVMEMVILGRGCDQTCVSAGEGGDTGIMERQFSSLR